MSKLFGKRVLSSITLKIGNEFFNHSYNFFLLKLSASEPMINTKCWHVYCETCWNANLNDRKTCIQCDVEMTSDDLRIIKF
jgi:hypothetical protein